MALKLGLCNIYLIDNRLITRIWKENYQKQQGRITKKLAKDARMQSIEKEIQITKHFDQPY